MKRQVLSTDRVGEATKHGDECRALSRFEDAIQAYQQAIRARGDDLTANEQVDLLVKIVDCHLELGDLEGAEETLASLAIDESCLRAEVAGALHVSRGYVALNRARYEETVREATNAWNLLRATGENTLLARALSCRGHGLRRLGRLPEAKQDFADAMASARRADNAHELGLASSNLGFLLWQRGEYVEAREHHRLAVEIHEGCGSETHLTRELFALAVDEYHAGAWKTCAALLTRCEERAREVGDRRLQVAIAIQEARLQLVRGEDPAASLGRAREIAESQGYPHDLILIGQVEGEAAMERGDWTRASEVLAWTWDRAKATSPQGEPGGDTAWRLALAEEHVGDPQGRALAILGRAAEVAKERGYRAVEASVTRAIGIVRSRRGESNAAAELLEQAIATLRTLRLPYELGRCLLALGEALAAASRPAEAMASLREARTLFATLGAGREERKALEAIAVFESSDDVPQTETHRELSTTGDDPFAAVVTQSPVMLQAVERARRIAPSRIPVLLVGETGTGKELFAKAIHAASTARNRPFLAVNCAAITETLLESELFGHVRGSFTGAVADRAGIFEAAEGGTVFLDEIGKAPLALQAKLLRVLDSGEVRRVGGTETIRVQVRIVAATNVDLVSLKDRELFLPDLYYRLRGFEVTIPALRERHDDHSLLFERFAGRPPSAAALQVLEVHDWPGNVRELKNLAESTAFLASGRGPISRDALPEWIREVADRAESGDPRLADVERRALQAALEKSGGNRSRAAKALGISRQTLYTKMARFGLEEEGRLTSVA